MIQIEDKEYDYRKRPYNKRERERLKHKRKWNNMVNNKVKKGGTFWQIREEK